jgi:hypothetical protein
MISSKTKQVVVLPGLATIDGCQGGTYKLLLALAELTDLYNV